MVEDLKFTAPESDSDLISDDNLGLRCGLVCILVGIILIGFNLSLISGEGKYYPKLTALGFISLYWGLGVLLCPGLKSVENTTKREALRDLFYESNAVTKIAWIVSIIAGIGACIYSIHTEYWDNIKKLFALTFAITSFLFIAKYVILFLKPPVDGKENPDEQTADGIPLSKIDLHDWAYGYYFPSKRICILGIVVAAAVLAISAACYRNLEFGAGSGNYNKKVFDNCIVEKLSEKVPVRFLAEGYDGIKLVYAVEDEKAYENSSEIDGETDEDEEEYYAGRNCILLPMETIVRHIACDDSFYITKFIIIDADGYHHEYSKKEIKRIKEVAEMLKENPPEECTQLIIPSRKISFEEKRDDLCIFTAPEYNSEYVLIWEIEDFAKFFGKQLGNGDEDYELDAASIWYGFNSGAFDDTNYHIAKFTDICRIFYGDKTESRNGLLFNFGLGPVNRISGNECVKQTAELLKETEQVEESEETSETEI